MIDAMKNPASPLRGRDDKALNVVQQMVSAYDSGNLQMSSPEIGEPENNIPMHQWHEELLYYARQALAATPAPDGAFVTSDVVIKMMQWPACAKYDLAFKLAENVGYTLVREAEHPDSPHHSATPAVGGEADLYAYIPDIVKNAMLTMWNYICYDSKHHPLDIDHGRGKLLTFEPKHWAQFTGEMVQRNIRDLFRLAAQPASPLRGLEIDAVSRCMEILEDVPGEHLIDRVHRIVDWHKQLSEQYYALSSAPPEQPSIAINVEKAAIALHRAVWNYTLSWEHENPKLKDHYRAQVAVVIKALAKEQPEYLSGCQLRGPGECQSRGMCLSDACQHAGKVIVKRMCVETQVDGILYPAKEPI
jgi:hypothetical protein